MLGLRNIFSGRSAKPVKPLLAIPEGQRVFCIGDIHGRADLLTQLMALLKDAEGAEGVETTYVFLGDYIDRGEHSREVIELLVQTKLSPIKTVFLRGNHEQVLLDFLEEPMAAKGWLNFGGMSTLISYGVPVRKIPTRPEDFEELQQSLRECLPADHIQFIRDTQISWEMGNCFFVHAGIHPKVKLADQSVSDLLWIKEEFVSSNRDYEKVVVHGHYIENPPSVKHNRIGIDTGAYISGILTCAQLEGDELNLLSTAPAGTPMGNS